AFQPTRGAFADAFVTELTANGTALQWSTYFGGNGDEGATAAIDSAGAIVVSGVTNSTDLPTSSGVVQPSIAGQWDGFVGKLSSNASRLSWLTYIGGSGDDGAEAVVRSSGANLVGGFKESADFPVTGGAFDPSYNGG